MPLPLVETESACWVIPDVVVNVWSAPLVVPEAFVATSR